MRINLDSDHLQHLFILCAISWLIAQALQHFLEFTSLPAYSVGVTFAVQSSNLFVKNQEAQAAAESQAKAKALQREAKAHDRANNVNRKKKGAHALKPGR